MNRRFEDSRLNVYVNLDCALPASLKLQLGQNLLFVREFSKASGPFLQQLSMPEPYFVTANLSYGVQIPGQPEGTYLVGLGLVHSVGNGVILISFRAQVSCTPSQVSMRLPFVIS